MRNAVTPRPRGSVVSYPDRQRLWLRLFSCSATLEKRIRTKLKLEFNASLPSFGILAALARAPEGLTMSELSDAVRISNATVTGIISNLSSRGFVLREGAEADKRCAVARLTPAGREAFVRMARTHGEWIERTFAALTDAQVSALLELLSVVRESIQENRI